MDLESCAFRLENLMEDILPIPKAKSQRGGGEGECLNIEHCRQFAPRCISMRVAANLAAKFPSEGRKHQTSQASLGVTHGHKEGGVPVSVLCLCGGSSVHELVREHQEKELISHKGVRPSE